MQYPDWLYYVDKQIAYKNVRDPTGARLNAQRCIEGKDDCWIKQSAPAQKKPTTLVLSDWTFEQRSDEALLELDKIFKDLIVNEGFTLLVYTSDGLVKLSHENLYKLRDIEFRRKIIPKPPQEIKNEVVSDKNISAEELRVLDYFEMRHLLKGVQCKEVDLHDISNSTFHKDSIIDVIKKTPPPKTFKHTTQSKKDNATFDYIINQHPTIKTKTCITSVELSGSASIDLNAIDPKTIEELNIKNIKDLNAFLNNKNIISWLKDLKNLKKINISLEEKFLKKIDNTLLEKSIIDILSASEKIESVSIFLPANKYSHVLKKEFKEQMLTQKHLKNILLTPNSKKNKLPYEDSNFNFTLPTKNTVTNISLIADENDDEPEIYGTLTNVENFTLYGATDPFDLNNFFKANKETLKKLSFIECGDLGLTELDEDEDEEEDDLDFEDNFDVNQAIFFPALEEINIKVDKSISTVYFKAPNLKKMTLSGALNQDTIKVFYNIKPKDNPLATIKELNINIEHPNGELAALQILNHASKLEKLHIQTKNITIKKTIDFNVEFPHLKEIRLTKSYIDNSGKSNISFYKNLIHRSPNLETLIIDDEAIETDFLNFLKSNHHKKLKKIIINYPNPKHPIPNPKKAEHYLRTTIYHLENMLKVNQFSRENNIEISTNPSNILLLECCKESKYAPEGIQTELNQLKTNLQENENYKTNLINAYEETRTFIVADDPEKGVEIDLNKTAIILSRMSNLENLTLNFLSKHARYGFNNQDILNWISKNKTLFENLDSLELAGLPENIMLSVKNLLLDSNVNVTWDERSIVKENQVLYLGSAMKSTSMATIDANTSNENKFAFNQVKIFKNILSPGGNHDPDVTTYRLDLYNEIALNPRPCNKNNAFKIYSSDNLKEELKSSKDLMHSKNNNQKIKIFKNKNRYNQTNKIIMKNNKGENDLHEGRISIKIDNQDWVALPSLSPDEKIECLKIPQKYLSDIELKYSKKRNLYYIKKKTKGNASFRVAFLISTLRKKPSKKLNAEAQEIFNNIKKFAKTCQDFTEGKIYYKKKSYTGRDYYETLLKEKKGACRHRSVVFKQWMKNKYPNIPVRIVTNVSHAFVEINFEGNWLTYDLGGYDAESNVLEPEEGREARIEKQMQSDISESIEYLSQENKLTTQIAQSFVETEILTDPFEQQSQEEANPLNPAFRTWEQKKIKEPRNPDEFSLDILRTPSQNILIEADDMSIENYKLYLEDFCLNKRPTPFYYINSPEDLVCASRWLSLDQNNRGKFNNGPGGSLHEFLVKNQKSDPPPVLIVNYNNFDTDDIVKFNTLIDKDRIADATEVPKKAIVIGLYNHKKPNAYIGSDFYSRFNNVIGFPEKLIPDLNQSCQTLDPKKPVPNAEENDNLFEIDLYNSNNWETLLLGKWIIKGQDLIYEDGKLITAIKNQQDAIVLKNAPWDNPKFNVFWEQLRLTGQFYKNGQWHTLPPKIKFFKRAGYDWNTLSNTINKPNQATFNFQEGFILNNNTFGQFFAAYKSQYQDELKMNVLFSKDGILAENKEQSIDIYLTEAMSAENWSLLLSDAHARNTTLKIFAPSNLIESIPSEIQNKITIQNAIEEEADLNNLMITAGQANLFIAQDPDYFISKNLETLDKKLIIDISEMEPTDIFGHPNLTMDQASGTLNLTHVQSQIWESLAAGETVILKGCFSTEMANALSDVCLQKFHRTMDNAKKNFQGKLILVTNDSTSLHFCNRKKTTAPSFNEKIALLNQKYGQKNSYQDILEKFESMQDKLSQYSYTELETMLKYVYLHPNLEDPTKFLDDFYELEEVFNANQHVNHLDLTEQASAEFEKQRMEKIMGHSGLASNPYVFVSGVTGVGKTTFILNNLKQKNDQYTIFFGEDKLEQWASDSQDQKQKILFIDEANITPRNFLEFEGLFNIPPTVFVNKKQYILSDKHKVVFAGNPLSYGGERYMPELFKRHDSSIKFDPMPPAYLYRKILKPVLDNFEDDAFNDHKKEEIAQIFLSIYQKVSAYSKEETLITARELQTMAMLVVSQLKIETVENSREIALNNAYFIASHVIPEKFKHDFDAFFTECCGAIPSENIPDDYAIVKNKDFIITQSRKPIYDNLLSLLNIRKLNGGLGGMILEGEPGVGKSHFIVATLCEQGYKKGNIHQPENGKVFYQIPVGMEPSEKIRCLLKAFHEGNIVVIDEINSSPMMERLLNALLMGYDLDGKPPKKSGFMVLGSQNPIKMAGRKATSPAIARRLLKKEFPSYRQAEMLQILIKKGLEEKRANKIISNYTNAYEFGVKFKLEPLPTFRAVLNEADLILESAKRKNDTNENELLSQQDETQNLDTSPTHEELKESNEKYKNLIRDTHQLAQELNNKLLNSLQNEVDNLKSRNPSAGTKSNSQLKCLSDALANANESQKNFNDLEADSIQQLDTNIKQLYSNIKQLKENLDEIGYPSGFRKFLTGLKKLTFGLLNLLPKVKLKAKHRISKKQMKKSLIFSKDSSDSFKEMEKNLVELNNLKKDQPKL